MKDKTNVHLTREHCTCIAAIASDPNVQQALPQVLLPNVRGEKRKWATVIKDKTDCPNVRVITEIKKTNSLYPTFCPPFFGAILVPVLEPPSGPLTSSR